MVKLEAVEPKLQVGHCFSHNMHSHSQMQSTYLIRIAHHQLPEMWETVAPAMSITGGWSGSRLSDQPRVAGLTRDARGGGTSHVHNSDTTYVVCAPQSGICLSDQPWVFNIYIYFESMFILRWGRALC
jgi:hypothetical protein